MVAHVFVQALRQLESEPYGWIITKDLLADDPEIGGDSEVGTMGPSRISPEHEAELKAGKGQRFRMLDDDGIPYYEGRYVGSDGDEMFGPLWDFGQPGSGCTEIQYWEPGKGGGWKSL